ncbi:MAG: dihydroneopterin aldolase [Rhizobiaceae bacterium]
MTCYSITLKNCAFFARHGIYSEEEALGQRFFVDATLTVEGGSSLEKDDLNGTADYGAVFRLIEKIVLGKRRYLIEALALDVAKEICREFEMVSRAEITIRKPNAPVQGVLDYVSVTVTHPENDS